MFIPDCRSKGLKSILPCTEDYAFKVRAVCTPAFREGSPDRSLDNWKAVIDSLAGDFNTVYFRTGRVFRSRMYPQSVHDTQSKLTDDDLSVLIDYCLAKGVKFYLGYGVFAWDGMDLIAEAHPETKARDIGGMCPSNETARRINIEYGMEMLERYPKADGIFLEMRDEYGPCFCDTCQQELDDCGSKQYGQSELSWLREFTEELWKRKPHAEIAVTIGYMERGSHTNDPMYYEGIRAMDEPRTYWVAVRNNYELPGAGGKAYPLSYFSNQIVSGMHDYAHTPKRIGEWLAQAQVAGAIGVCPVFEPGCQSQSYYTYNVPFPTDTLPYRITRSAFQEYSIDPQMTDDRFTERVADTFFDSSADPQRVIDLVYLCQMIQEACGSWCGQSDGSWKPGWFRELMSRAADPFKNGPLNESEWKAADAALTKFHQLLDKHGWRLAEIEASIPSIEQMGDKAIATAWMMRRAIDDTRHELMFADEDRETVDLALRNARSNVPEGKG